MVCSVVFQFACPDWFLSSQTCPARPVHLLVACGRRKCFLVAEQLSWKCTSGRTAVWFAQRGFSVDVIDVSRVALCTASGFAGRLGVSSKVTWREVDLDGGIGTSDTYDVVLCQHFRDRKLNSQLAARTAPGGLLLVAHLDLAKGLLTWLFCCCTFRASSHRLSLCHRRTIPTRLTIDDQNGPSGKVTLRWSAFEVSGQARRA